MMPPRAAMATTLSLPLPWPLPLPSSKMVASMVRMVVTDLILPLSGPSATVSTFSTQSFMLWSPRR